MSTTGHYEARHNSELTVITKTKDLINYIFLITQKSPKKYRFSIIIRLQNLILDVLSNIYKANETYIDIKLIKDIEISIDAIKNDNNYKSETEKYHKENKILTLKLAKATKFDEKVSKRLDYQNIALTSLKELDCLVVLAREVQCISPKNQENMAKQINEIKKLLGAWIKNDRTRYNY